LLVTVWASGGRGAPYPERLHRLQRRGNGIPGAGAWRFHISGVECCSYNVQL